MHHCGTFVIYQNLTRWALPRSIEQHVAFESTLWQVQHEDDRTGRIGQNLYRSASELIESISCHHRLVLVSVGLPGPGGSTIPRWNIGAGGPRSSIAIGSGPDEPRDKRGAGFVTGALNVYWRQCNPGRLDHSGLQWAMPTSRVQLVKKQSGSRCRRCYIWIHLKRCGLLLKHHIQYTMRGAWREQIV